MYSEEIQALERKARRAMYHSFNSDRKNTALGARLAIRWYRQAELIRAGHTPEQAQDIIIERTRLLGYDNV